MKEFIGLLTLDLVNVFDLLTWGIVLEREDIITYAKKCIPTGSFNRSVVLNIVCPE